MEQDALALPELLLRCRRLVQTLRLTRELQEATAATVAAAAAAACLLYTSPSPRDRTRSRMPSSA